MEKLHRYEEFAFRLRDDLGKVLKKRDEIYTKMSEYHKLSVQLELIEEKTKMNVGCDFFMDATIIDKSKIILCIGLDVYLEMDALDALEFIKRETRRLEATCKKYTEKIAEIKANIKLVMQTIKDLNTISARSL